MPPPPEHIEGTRVVLRRIVPADASALFAVADDADVMRYMDWPRPADRANIARHLAQAARHWQDGIEFQWAILDRATRALAGTVSCRPHGDTVEVGYFLGRSAWGRGLASEATRRVVAWFLDQPGVACARATTDVDNLRSRSLLERIGMRLEVIRPKSTDRPNLGGPPRDTAVYVQRKGEA